MANHVKKRRKLLGLTQQQVADAAATTKATVMKLEKGNMQLTESWIKRLSVPLKCRPEDLVSDQGPVDVPLVGEVGERGLVHFYTDLEIANGVQEPSREVIDSLQKVPTPPEAGYRNLAAVRVIGDAMAPLLPNDSLLYYADPVTEGFDDYVSKQLLIGLSNGDIILGSIESGDNFGSYHIHRHGASILKNKELSWCAKVVFMRPNFV